MSEISVRWIVKGDIERVSEIDRECFPKPWTGEDFSECLRQKQNIGKVAELDGKIVGFVLYELCRKKIYLLNMGVKSSRRRIGVGRRLIDHLKQKLEKPEYWLSIETHVSEENLSAHVFLRSMGFKAVSVERGFFSDEDGLCDGYMFVFANHSEAQEELIESEEGAL